MLVDRPKQQFMVDVVKQSFDVKLHNPLVTPAPLARDPYSSQGRFPRPVALGAVPLSRETGFSPEKEEHDTKVVLPESRYDLSVLPPSLESVAAICVLAVAEEGLCAKLDVGERN